MMKNYSRRDFVKAATLSAAVLSTPFNILGAQTVDGIHHGTIRVGLIGCGGRGKGALTQFLEACQILGITVEVVAVADVFQDRTQDALNQFKLDASKGHVGYESYREVTASNAEFVIMATPPSFRPRHLEAAVEAGKHCFIEKPIAVDPAGALKVIELGELAKAKGLTVVAGIQRRYDAKYQTAKAQIEAGAIGQILGGVVSWNGVLPWISSRRDGQSDAHYMTRNWLNFTEMSGDHIVEQHVHQLDVANWYLGRTPISFSGMGGRARRETGNQFDFFSVDMDYGDNVHIHSQCRQIAGCYNRVGESFRGTDGWTVGTKVEGKNVSVPKVNVMAASMIQEHIELIKSARGPGVPLNDARAVAEATLCAIGGRISAYTGQLIRWSDLVSNEKSPFYAMQLSPSPVDFERGTVVMPVEAPVVPGKKVKFHNRG